MNAKAKQIGREVVAAAEDYLLEFIWIARTHAQGPALDEKRERLFKAIDAAIDAADKR